MELAWYRQGPLAEAQCLEKPHGQRSLADCSPRGRKESDMTKVTAQRQAVKYVTQARLWLEKVLGGEARGGCNSPAG